jgi:hypothetical protein
MDFLKRLFGGKPANSANGAPALSSGATAPQMPTSTSAPNSAPTSNTTAVVGGRRRSRKQTRKHRKQSRKNARK